MRVHKTRFLLCSSHGKCSEPDRRTVTETGQRFILDTDFFFPAIITSDKNQKTCSSPARCDSHRAALCKTSAPTLVSFGGRLPVLCTDHRQAHLALLINVGVVDLCLECDLGRLERVLGGENDFNPECTFVIRRVVLKGNQ